MQNRYWIFQRSTETPYGKVLLFKSSHRQTPTGRVGFPNLKGRSSGLSTAPHALAQPDEVAWVCQRPTVVLGDFNTNAKNESDGWRDLKSLLDSLGLVSAYHEFTGEGFGKESHPTHFHHKNGVPESQAEPEVSAGDLSLR